MFAQKPDNWLQFAYFRNSFKPQSEAHVKLAECQENYL